MLAHLQLAYVPSHPLNHLSIALELPGVFGKWVLISSNKIAVMRSAVHCASLTAIRKRLFTALHSTANNSSIFFSDLESILPVDVI